MYQVYIAGSLCSPDIQCVAHVERIANDLKQLPHARLKLIRTAGITAGTPLRIASGGTILFDGFVTAIERIPGVDSAYDVEAAGHLYLRGDRRVYFLARNDTLKDLITELVSTINTASSPQIAYAPRSFEEQIRVDGEFYDSAIDILNLIFEQTGIKYQLAIVNNELRLLAVKTRDIKLGDVIHYADKLNLPVLGWAGYMSQSKAMLTKHGEFLKGLPKALFVRSVVHEHKVSADVLESGSQACAEPNYPSPERNEPCVVFSGIAFDLNRPIAVNLRVPPVNRLLGQSIPITNLALRGYIVRSRHSEGYDSRFDITIDLDYWRRTKGGLRIYIREELAGDWIQDPFNPDLPPVWNPNIIEVIATAWKEVIVAQPNAIEPVFVNDYKTLDDSFWQGLSHGQVLAPEQISDPYLLGLFSEDPRGEAEVLLLDPDITPEYWLINEAGSREVGNINSWLVGLVHVQQEPLTRPISQLTRSLGVVKHMSFAEAFQMRLEPSEKYTLEEIIIQSRRMYQGKVRGNM